MESVINEIKSKSAILIAVTKLRSIDEIKAILNEGISNIGENRLEEAIEKFSHLPSGLKKHFIGNIQSKKIKDIVRYFDVIHSVDRLKIIQKINEECQKINKVMPILMQVNTSNEAQKGGVMPHELISLIKEVQGLKNINIVGLMTMAIDTENKAKIRGCFQLLKHLLAQVKKDPSIDSSHMKELSMGMSNDYQIALEEGATMIRIGRKLFN